MIFVCRKSSLLYGRLAGNSKSFAFISSSHIRTSLFPFSSNTKDPSPKSAFIVNYLIDSVGLSSSEATEASKRIAHIESNTKPDSVLEFFRKNGFSDADIKKIILKHAIVLCANVDSTLKPKIEALRRVGFSETQINKLVTSNPYGFHYFKALTLPPKIEFLSAFLKSNDDLVKAFSKPSLICCDLEKQIKPKVSFLRECQVSDERIGVMLTKHSNVMGRAFDSFKDVAKRANQLGISCGSGMFFQAFCFLNIAKADIVDAKFKLLGSLGFSSSELLSAISRHPQILGLSAENLCTTINFLVNKAGLDICYVSSHPAMLSLSLTRRLIPRNYVLQLIKKKGLLKRRLNLYSVVTISEKKFMEKYIFSFKEMIPELHDDYLSVCAGKFIN